MKLVTAFACTLPLLAACASTTVAPDSEAGPSSSAPSPQTLAKFEALKSLAGDWYSPKADGTPEGAVMLSYRVSSNGSAVIETTFPGQDFEMTTVYTLDLGDLVLTHYCAIGNAPRMLASPEGDGSSIHFECTGVGNAASHDEMHMHDAAFAFEEDGRLRSVWTIWAGGALGKAESFELVRG